MTRYPLLSLLLIFTLLWGVYVWLIPPFEGPDGPQHWAYVVWLVEERTFPPQGAAAWQTNVQQEAGQPPLYYLLAAIPAALWGVDNPPAHFQPNPYFPSAAPGTVPDNKMVAVYEGARPLTGGWLSLAGARGISLLAGWLTIVFTFALAREIWPEKPRLAVTAAALVAFTPQVLFLSSVVSNDMLAAALSTATSWQLARLIRQGTTGPRLLGLGVLWGLAALSKSNALLLGVPIGLAVGGWRLVVDGWPLAAGDWRRYGRESLLWGGWIALGFGLVAGWWYGRVWWLYGSPLGTEVHCYAPWAYCDIPLERHNPLAQWGEVVDSTWAAFGWGNIKFPGWVYGLGWLWLAAAAFGLGRSIWPYTPISTRVPSIHGRSAKRERGRPFLLFLLLIALLVQGVALEGWMRQVTAPHGRLLFPALGATAVLVVTGWYAWHPRLAMVAWGPPLFLTLAATWLLLYPAYFPSRPLAQEQVLAEQPPIGWHYGDFVQLLTLTPQSRSVRAGETLRLQSCWQTGVPTDGLYAVAYQLVGAENRVVTRRQSYPDLGRRLTSQWLPGQVYCETMGVAVPPDLAQTGVYQIELLWLDEQGERLPAYGADGPPLTTTFAGMVRLQAESTVIGDAAADQPTITLAQYTLPDTWIIGQTQAMTLTWQLNQPVTTDYTVFIHFRTADGQNSFAGDGPPLAGWYPTSWWLPGELVPDRHEITPADLAPGLYQLVVGWYDPLTGTRLGDEIQLGEIIVRR